MESASGALVCICGVFCTVVELVTSAVVAMDEVDGGALVASVRARERVHRLPFTVVIDSGGEAIRATSHRKTGRKGLGDED